MNSDHRSRGHAVLDGIWRWLGRPWLQRRALRLTGPLDTAIRAGDASEVLRLLNAGAPLQSCILDHEGYHTPLELARRSLNPAVVELLEAHLRSSAE